MVRNGRQKGALWLIGELLERIASETSLGGGALPSNLAWPSLGQVASSSAACEDVFNEHASQSAKMADIDVWFDKNEFFRPGAADEYELMTYIWSSLARLVLDTMTMSEVDARETMSFVLIVLAGMHRLDLMPHDIYHYDPSVAASNVQRPPILHMVSSRVLQSLSDAVWRDLQDEAVEEAVKQLGVSLREVLKEPPGGRFRLSVKPLAPELWIEMFLWCCIEGGHAHAASNILKMLHEETENPWFAIRWNQPNAHGTLHGHIDWERVELRTGGTVGRVEGYSHDEPFVTIPERTVSVEAVLAVIETLINSNIATTHQQSMSNYTQSTIHKITKAASFLEPHDLPKSYFDYLGTRLLQLDAFDMAVQPIVLKRWSRRLKEMSGLATITKPCRHQNLELESILTHGLAFPGIQHQALDGLVQIGDVHNSLDLFNEIQETVDRSKVNDIEEFLGAEDEDTVEEEERASDVHEEPLGSNVVETKPYFETRLPSTVLEYAHSHGQLPLHKVAGLLNLISDNNLVGLGQWMLYADELDGPLVPQCAYRHHSFTAALYRFASISGDTNLLDAVMNETLFSKRMTSVRVMRSLVNAHITFGNYGVARRILRQLAMAQGGGPSAMILAHLAAQILHLERACKQEVDQDQPSDERRRLKRACTLLTDLIRGLYDCKTASFRMDQIALYRQQIAHVLRLMARIQGSVLPYISQLYVARFLGGNQISLPVLVFNRFLSAVVETCSAQKGLELWQLFCNLDRGLTSVEVDDMEGTEEMQSRNITEISTLATTESVPGDELELEFDNPFFQNLPTKDVEPLPEPEEANPQRGLRDGLRGGAAMEQARELLAPFPLTRPNLQTVRLILRATVKERQAPSHVSRSKSKHNITEWAVEILSKHGLSGEMIAQEIATPLSQLQAQYPEFGLQSGEHNETAEGGSITFLPFERLSRRYRPATWDAAEDNQQVSKEAGSQSALWSG